MKKYSKLIRTTLGEYLAKPCYKGAGIYVIACYPSLGCLYVGISDGDVHRRLREHLSTYEPLSQFLRLCMADACGFRLDVLCPPADSTREWLLASEKRLVQCLRPAYNEQNLGQ